MNKKNVNWIISFFGLLSFTLSLVFVFTTNVFAACSASTTCPAGTPNAGQVIECSCPGNGACLSSSTSVGCTCQGDPQPVVATCGGSGES